MTNKVNKPSAPTPANLSPIAKAIKIYIYGLQIGYWKTRTWK